MTATNTPLICPGCGRRSRVTQTQYGRRDSCDFCGVHSWDSKPLVTPDVHAARQQFHAAFDPLWQRAHEAYPISETPGTKEHAKAIKRIQKAARGRAYRWLSKFTGLPEPECHGGEQTDLNKLARLTAVARSCCGPQEIRQWWKTNKAA